MKGARRSRNRQGAGFADLMAVPPQPKRGVVTGMSRFQQQSSTNTPTATAQTTPSSSTPSTPRPSPRDEDWDSLLNISPRRRISPINSKLGSRSRPGSASMDPIPHRTPKASSLKLSSSRQSMPPLSSPPPATPTEPSHLPPISPRVEPKPAPAPSARSSLTPVPSFLAGWEGNDGWGDDPLDESDAEVDDEAWGGWGDAADISIPEQTKDPIVREVTPSPTTQSSASPILVKHEVLVLDAKERQKDTADVETRTAPAEDPLQQSTPVNFGTPASAEGHLEQTEQEKTEPVSQSTIFVFGEETTEPEAQAANTGNDDAWGQWEEIDNFSVQPAPVSKNEATFDEPPQAMLVQQTVQSEVVHTAGKVDNSSALDGANAIVNEERNEMGAMSFKQVNDGDADREHLDHTNVEHKQFLDEPFEAAPQLTEILPSEGVDENAIVQEEEKERGAMSIEHMNDSTTDRERPCHTNVEHKQFMDEQFEAAPQLTERLPSQGVGKNAIVHEEEKELGAISIEQMNDGTTDREHLDHANVKHKQFMDEQFEATPKLTERLPSEGVGDNAIESGGWAEWDEFGNETVPEEPHFTSEKIAGSEGDIFGGWEQVENVPAKTEKSLAESSEQHEAEPFLPPVVSEEPERLDVNEDAQGKEELDQNMRTPIGNEVLPSEGVEDNAIESGGWAEWDELGNETVSVEPHSTSEKIAGGEEDIFGGWEQVENVPAKTEKSLAEPSEHHGAELFLPPIVSNEPVRLDVNEDAQGKEELDQNMRTPISNEVLPSEGVEDNAIESGGWAEWDELGNETVPVEPHSTSEKIAGGEEDIFGGWEQVENVPAKTEKSLAEPSEHHEAEPFLPPIVSNEPVRLDVNEDAQGKEELDQNMRKPIGNEVLPSEGVEDNAIESGGWAEWDELGNETVPVEPHSTSEKIAGGEEDIFGGWEQVENVPAKTEKSLAESSEQHEAEPFLPPVVSNEPERLDVNEDAQGKEELDQNMRTPIGNKVLPSEGVEDNAIESGGWAERDGFGDTEIPVEPHSTSEKIAGGEEDIFGGWEQVENVPAKTEKSLAESSEQHGAESFLLPVVSEQPVRLDEIKDALDKEQVDRDMHKGVGNNSDDQRSSARNESLVPTVEISDHRTAEERNDSNSSDVNGSSTESKNQMAFSTSYWTEKLNSANIQGHEHRISSSFMTSGTEANVIGNSERTADDLRAENSRVPGLDRQRLSYDPFAPAADSDPSNQSRFDDFDVTRASADETIWYQRDTEKSEAVKGEIDVFKTNEGTGEHRSFDATLQSEGTDKNGAPNLSTQITQTRDPFDASDTFAGAFDQSEPFVSEEAKDRDHLLSDSYPPNQPVPSSFEDESDFSAYAPRRSQVFSASPQNDEDSNTASLLGNEDPTLPSTGGLIPFPQDASQPTDLCASEPQINMPEPTPYASANTDVPGEQQHEPYKPVPETSDLAHSFDPQELSMSEDADDAGANYAPRQRFQAAPNEYGVERNVPFDDPYPFSHQEPGSCTVGTKDTHSPYDEPYSTTATTKDLSAAYWGQGSIEQRGVEASADNGFPISAEAQAMKPNIQTYQPVPKDPFPSYPNALEPNPEKSSPTEIPIPNAYTFEGYGNYTASTPAIPEAQQDSTYMDTSMFSYPFSIMDTNPSGDMIHLGARPIISWSFVGSFVTVFPATENEHVDGVPMAQKNGNGDSRCVQVFEVNPLGADGANDDWVAAAEAVEPVSYPVQTPELEAYAKMCDDLSRLSVGLHGPAAESRAALWRVLALLCRTGHEDWRRFASRAVCGPTSVPLFGTKREESTTMKDMNELSSGSLSKKCEVTDRDVTNEVERLLTEGKGIDAVNYAKTYGLWSLALVLAGMVDRKLYMSVLCDFAKATLHEGSALQTLCFSLSENDSEITRRITSPAGLTEWRKNVGMLLTSGASIATDNEKSKRFMSLIDQVGDALLAQNDDVVGSHVCYLLSGRLDSLNRNKICLLGANSNIAPGRPRSFGSPAAILQSLVFEAIVNARSKETCPHLLPFRLLLALEIASVGRAKVALAHCNSISKEVRALFESGNNSVAQLFTPPFLSCLESFEHQLQTYLGVQEKGEKLTRLSALGKSLSSVFARGLKDQAEKQSPQELGIQTMMARSQSYIPNLPAEPVQIHTASGRMGGHVHPNQSPYLSLDSQHPGVSNLAQVSQFTDEGNGTLEKSTKKEKSGKEKWDYLVQKTVGLIAPADYDLSPPPPSRAPPAVFGGHGQPSPFGLDGGAGTGTPGQVLAPSHMRSASVGALPSEYLSSSQFAGNAVVTTGQRDQPYGDSRHVSTPQIDMSSGKMDQSSDNTEQALFNGVPVQKATRAEKNDALVHRRSASDMTLQSQTSEKKPPLHPKKPARAKKQSDTSMEKPQSKGWRERLREKLTAAFSGPPRAHMGEENKFVFDKKRGRWVIEGEDPDEDEDIPPPPPDDDNMFGSEGSNVQTSASYDMLPNPSNNDHNTTALMRSQSAQDARDLNSFNVSSSHDQMPVPFNPFSSYSGSLDNSVGGDDGSATSVASAASAPVPYSTTPSITASSAGNSNKYRAGLGKRSNRRAYVDTFNKGKLPAPASAIPTPARPTVPAFGGITPAMGGGYKIFTPTPAPSASTGTSDAGHGANSSASVVETSDQMTNSGSEVSSTQHAPHTSSSHSDALPPKPPSYTSSLGSGRQSRMMA